MTTTHGAGDRPTARYKSSRSEFEYFIVSIGTSSGGPPTIAADMENGSRSGDVVPNASASWAGRVRPSCHACAAGLKKRKNATTHNVSVIPAMTEWPRRTIQAPIAKQRV